MIVLVRTGSEFGQTGIFRWFFVMLKEQKKHFLFQRKKEMRRQRATNSNEKKP